MQGARKENKTNAEWAIKHVLCWVHGAAKQQQVTRGGGLPEVRCHTSTACSSKEWAVCMRIWVVVVQGASCSWERTRSATRRQQGLALRCSGQCNMMARGQLHAHCSGWSCSPAWGLTHTHEGRRTQMHRQVVTLTHRVAALTKACAGRCRQRRRCTAGRGSGSRGCAL